MSSVASEGARGRRRLTTAVRESMREAAAQFALLNNRVSARLELKDVDLQCLDLIAREGPISPSALARRAALHPATMTGILDRLERAGWVARERDPADRRGVVVRPERTRSGEVLRLYAGMTSSMDEICADYDEETLVILAEFLRRAADAAHHATEAL
jgi:DNA-binding MarR family transcriptional regulator